MALKCFLTSRLRSSVLALGCLESGWNFTSVQIDQIKNFPLLADLGLGCGCRKFRLSPCVTDEGQLILSDHQIRYLAQKSR
jgi:hypothetical protein